jgi:hypothetical protein
MHRNFLSKAPVAYGYQGTGMSRRADLVLVLHTIIGPA